jgi:transketolase
VLYANEEYFPIGQSKTLHSSTKDAVTVVAAGVTVHEALKAHDALAKEGIAIRVIDLYSVKPIDDETLRKAAAETKAIVSVEDHSVSGGIGEAVAAVVAGQAPVEILGIRELPRSGKPAELMKAYGIDAGAIVAAVKRLA